MKRRSAYAGIFGVFLLSCVLLVFFRSAPPSVDSSHASAAQGADDKKGGLAAADPNERPSGKARDRQVKSDKDALAKPAEAPPIGLIDDDGELDGAVLESQGLSKAQIDAAKEVLYEISKEIAEHFIENCSEERGPDGSFIYVLKGDADLAVALENKARARLGEVIGLNSSGARLAGQITEGLKNRALLNYGADDMVAAAYRGVDREGKGWEDGILINGKMPGMIDYYRKNGWPDGDSIHESGGKAIFHPIKKTEK